MKKYFQIHLLTYFIIMPPSC